MGALWACSAVGLAFGLHTLASMVVVQILDGVEVTAFVARCLPPLAACLPMVAAVLAARHFFAPLAWRARGAELVVEIAVGGAAYVACVPFVARSTFEDMMTLARLTLRRHGTPQPRGEYEELSGG